MSGEKTFTIDRVGGYRKVTGQEQLSFGLDIRTRFLAHFTEALPNGATSFCGGLKKTNVGLWVAAPWPATADSEYGAPAENRDDAVRNCAHLAIAQAMREAPGAWHRATPEATAAAAPVVATKLLTPPVERENEYNDVARDAGPELLTKLTALLAAYTAISTKRCPAAQEAAALINRILAAK